MASGVSPIFFATLPMCMVGPFSLYDTLWSIVQSQDIFRELALPSCATKEWRLVNEVVAELILARRKLPVSRQIGRCPLRKKETQFGQMYSRFRVSDSGSNSNQFLCGPL